MKILFDKKLFLVLSFAFIITTVVGTLSHEFGHYVVAKSVGYKASIHYAYTHVENAVLFDQRIKYSFWISIGGPLQTLLTGTIGLILLFVWKRSFEGTKRLKAGQWTLIFITLFWLRQTANLLMWVISFLVTKSFSYSDEIGIAIDLGLPSWLLLTLTGVIGLMVLCAVFFIFIPKPQRLTFILAGIIGGMAGYILWLVLSGTCFDAMILPSFPSTHSLFSSTHSFFIVRSENHE